MSTYAAIFMLDEYTGKYNGISIKYDGYIQGGAGEELNEYWNDFEKVKALCNGPITDFRGIFPTLEDTINNAFTDERKERINKFRNLTRDQMLNQGHQFDYLYVYSCADDPDAKYKWYYVDKENNFISFNKIL